MGLQALQIYFGPPAPQGSYCFQGYKTLLLVTAVAFLALNVYSKCGRNLVDG